MIFIKLKNLYFFILRLYFTALAKYKVNYYGVGLKVNYKCNFTKNTNIGIDSHFNGMSIIGSGNVVIGDHFHSGSEILIITQNHNYYSPDALPYDTNDIVKNITIGNSCWLGSRVIVLPGTTIEDGVVVQAGAVLFGKIPKYSIVGGNPWRIIKYRDKIKYDMLVEQNKYV